MKFLQKLLIKDFEQVHSPKVRMRYGVCAGVMGIISNAVLFAAKLAVSILSGSVAILADAINNLSDLGSSTAAVAGFKLSARPADSEHPYGHARYENITALLIAIFIFAVGIILGKSSVEKIINKQNAVVGTYTFIVLGAAIVIKLVQGLIYRDFGRAIKSQALEASAKDSRNDVIATSAVLLSAVITKLVGAVNVSIDGIFGLAVSVFIVVSAIFMLKSTIDPLIGERPNPELVKKIKDKLSSYEGVIGMHDLMIHTYGAGGRCFALVHVEMSANADVMALHDAVDAMERDFEKELGIHLTIHMDPVADNAETEKYKSDAIKILESIGKDLTMHDFRVVAGGSAVKILFDAVVPHGNKTTAKDIEAAFEKFYLGRPKKHIFIIKIDKPFF